MPFIPPKYADIGKSTSDLLNKDFPVSVTKLEVKTTTSNGVSFTVAGSQDTKGAVASDLKCKFTDKAHGKFLNKFALSKCS
jgi:voltage-dependent anion channel protein 2